MLNKSHWGCTSSSVAASRLSTKARWEYCALLTQLTDLREVSKLKTVSFCSFWTVAPLRQKLSSGGASVLPVIREDILAVQPFNWGASVMWEFKWKESSPFSSSQCWCLGMIGGTREERWSSEDGGRCKVNRLQQRAGRRKNIVYFLVLLLFWDLGNGFKPRWATERDDDWFGHKKVPGLLTCSLPLVERKLVSILWILFHLPTTLKPLPVLSDSTWRWFCENFSNDRIFVEYRRSCNLFLRWLFGTLVPWMSD